MNAETKFTPGPWHVYQAVFDRDAVKRGWREIHHTGHKAPVAIDWFARTSGGETETLFGVSMTEADALLIAAAPSLFEELVFAYDATKDDDGRWIDRNGDYVRVLNQAEGISIPA